MRMSHVLANKTSPGDDVRRGLHKQVANQVAAGFAGFFAFAFFVDVAAGLMLSGLPTGAAVAALGSGPERKKARHCGESCDFLATMQAVTRSMSGISDEQRRKASGWQAACSSGV